MMTMKMIQPIGRFMATLGMGAILLSCNNDNEVPDSPDNPVKPTFDTLVEHISGDEQTTPTTESIQKIDWKCVAWNSSTYENKTQTITRNDFDESLNEADKLKIYRIEDGKFIVSAPKTDSQARSSESRSFDYKFTNGTLTIEGATMQVRTENGSLILYYDYKDITALQKVFDVNLKPYYDPANINKNNYIGIIRLVNSSPTLPTTPPDKPTTPLGEFDAGVLAQNLVNSTQMGKLIPGVYSLIDQEDSKRVQIFGLYGGDTTAIIKQPLSMNGYTSSRGKEIFEAFFKGATFIYKNVPMKITSISKQGRMIGVIGKIEDGILVSFYYGIAVENDLWISPPPERISTPFDAATLTNDFIGRKPIDGKIFETIERLEDSKGRLLLSSSQETNKNISLKSPIILDKIESPFVRDIFGSLYKREKITFKGISLDVFKVSTNVEQNSILVYATDSEGTSRTFVYDFVKEAGEWE
ncbi:hypothetical protein FUAX_41610 (plasmid) [Fulvitalea axinellae]|uniref:DUF5689 domain-containing protein n=1 Tax=Fulvitalea axinellae TaxID=1182444 RepID=A0AAU9CHT9_9BACT|nr:hypothetical protein FUAX_41610 [Fulvitalea axinellae]